MNRAALSKDLTSSVSVTEVLVVPSATQLCHDCCTPCRFLFQQEPSVALLVRDVHFGEDGTLEFPTQRESDQFVLVATVPL